MNQIVVGGVSGLVSGALYGGIGAAVSQRSDTPVLKGAAISGLIGGTLATLVFAIRAQREAEEQLSGPQPGYSSDVLGTSGARGGAYFP